MTNRTIASLLVGAALSLAQIAAIGTAALSVSTTAANASNEPIPGVDIIVKKNPANNLAVHTETDRKGNFNLGHLAPGSYTIQIGQSSWAKAMGASAPGGAPRYANIEVNYLLQRMEGNPIAVVRLPVSHGESSGTFTIPRGKSADGDAEYRGTLTAEMAVLDRGVTHDVEFEKARTAPKASQGRVSTDADMNENCAKRSEVRDSHDRYANGARASAACRDRYIGETEKNLRK